MSIIRMDENAWREGYLAGSTGQSNKCPYQEKDARALAWASGYTNGKANPGKPPQMNNNAKTE